MPDFIDQLRCRLLELGCPADRMRRMVREVAEHRDDLLVAAQMEGVGVAEAEARLGSPQVLAEELMESLRHATWCGRHRFISFGLLPLLLFPVFWLLALFFGALAGYLVCCGGNEITLKNLTANPVALSHLLLVLRGTDYITTGLLFLGFCLLARRSGAGFKWLGVAGLICAVYALFLGWGLMPYTFYLSFTIHPNWLRAAIPLSMLVLACWRRQRVVHEALKTAR